ncbi:MAG TPA: 2-oxo acid dehydrogenase subunit E2 [Dehalococcoidia bacterium]|jgi:pyruvate/2-oxoglutarate dehydrogenase complex dihydrolipoamide acyltransferase (E2) component|nr:2-oxo acid dehydrogenase subunit E2 [Dehalococcoidia bacterium]
MAIDIVMPKLGVEMTQGRVVEWRKGEGQAVEKGEVLFVVETEKITYEVEALASGYLHILVPVDKEVPVAHLIGQLAQSQAEYQEIAAKAVPEAEMPAPKGAEVRERERISPLARNLAREHGIDITTVIGTGPGGRIMRQDILRAIEERSKAAPVTKEAPLRAVKETIPLKGMMRAMAQRMLGSLQNSAQFTQFDEIDVTELVKLHQQLVAAEEQLGARISYPALFTKMAAMVLKEQPMMNCTLDGDEVKLWEDINIGMAVAVEGGLIVPVVRQADKKSLIEIEQALGQLIEKARTKRLMPDDISGNTFTISNFGSFGALAATPILNPPESALLGVGKIREKPVVIQGQIAIRSMMWLSLTVDHRIIDGATAGRFMQRFAELAANPAILPHS